MRKLLISSALAMMISNPAMAADTTPPSVLVYGSSGATVADTVKIRALKELAISVADDEDPAATVTSIMLEGGHLAAPESLTPVSQPKPLSKPLSAAVVEGPFEIVDDTCSGAILGAPGSGGDTCTLGIKPVPLDNGPMAGTLRVTVNGKNHDLAISATASGLQPATLTISSDTSCTANRQTFTACGTYTITNTGYLPALNVAVVEAGSHPDQFVPTSTCGSSIAGGGTCTVNIGAENLTTNDTFSATYKLSYGSGGAENVGQSYETEVRTTTATVSGWRPTLVWVNAVGSGMNVTGPTTTGTAKTFTLRNDGEIPSGVIGTQLVSATNFTITSDACAGQALAVGATCNVTVQPKASQDGPYSTTLRATYNSYTADLALSGTASGFYSWYSGSWGSCSASPSWSWGTCSASCGGGTQTGTCVGTSGTQTRTVYCRRSDGAQVADSFCGGGKPSTSQSCSASCSGSNTQSCNTQSCGPKCNGTWVADYALQGSTVIAQYNPAGTLAAVKTACQNFCNSKGSTVAGCQLSSYDSGATWTCQARPSGTMQANSNWDFYAMQCN